MDEAAFNEVRSLIILQGLTHLVNLTIAALLWRKTGSRLYRTLLIVWLAQLLNFGVHGPLSGQVSIVRVLAFSIALIGTLPLARLLGDIAGIRVPTRPFVAATAAAIALSALLYLAGAPKLVYCFPVPFAVSLPGYFASLNALLRHRARLSASTLGLATVMLLQAFHITDFWFLHDVQSVLVPAFTLSTVLVFAIAVFAPAAINELVSMENEKLRSRMEYEGKLVQSARLAAIGELAGGIAHEVNNPLAIASMNVAMSQEMLSDRSGSTDEIARCLGSTAVALDRIARIVSSLRIFAGHKVDGNAPEAAVRRALEDVVTIAGDRARATRVELRAPSSVPDLAVQCPASELLQVLVGLIGNACDAVETLADRWVQLSCESSQGRVTLRVTDSGSGIAPEIAEKLMQPFFTTKPMGKGTGLGLSIARGLVRNRGGDLRYELHQGHTSFVIDLPLGVPASARPGAHQPKHD